MTISVVEMWDSRSTTLGDSPSVDTRWLVLGTDSDVDAHVALIAALTPFYGGLPLQETSVEHLAPGAWTGKARYGAKEPSSGQEGSNRDPGDFEFSFDTTGGTHKITQSLETVRSYAPEGFTPPDYFGAIGVTKDNVEGCDVTVPIYKFTEKHILAPSTVTGAYKSALFELTGTTNIAPFRDFEAGEVLFMGAKGSFKDVKGWELNFDFAASPNVVGLSIGPILAIEKRGWDYLWIRYNDAEDTAARAMVKRPVAVYTEKVYPDGDFSKLGI